MARQAAPPPLSRTTREPSSPQRTIVRPQSSTIAGGVRSCSILFLSSSALRRVARPIAARSIAARDVAYCCARCGLWRCGARRGLLRCTSWPIAELGAAFSVAQRGLFDGRHHYGGGRLTRRSPWWSELGGIARAIGAALPACRSSAAVSRRLRYFGLL